MNWNHNHENHLKVLNRRVEAYRIKGNKITSRKAYYTIEYMRPGYSIPQVRRPYGTRGYVRSERQYVLDRFRSHFGLAAHIVSDQAIWAKYNRVVNGAVARKAKVANMVDLSDSYASETTHVKVVKGMALALEVWNSFGLKRIGEGATRVVFDLGDGKVLKVYKPGWADGRQSNLREAEVWRKIAATENRDMVAEVFAADPQGNWLVMEKVAKAGNGVDFSDNARKRKIDKVLRNEYSVSDLHGGNWGNRANGQLVAVDYASA